ncbi:MAG: hypothetical protein HPY66_3289 [Firmicutes bacterium]|nr:hypothetical protein [Bacillota bacterium]MDI6705294.1 hypothetical protein [Bacillota bacterium]
MNRFTSLEHIITRASGVQWCFSLKDSCIFYRVLGDSSDAGGKQLLENVAGEFSADIDSSDNIHLVCINRKGDLLYLMNNGENWYNKQLATFPVDKYRIMHLTISCWNKYINVFYAISPLNNPLMWNIHHNFWNGSKWGSFKVVQVTGDTQFCPFHSGYDHTGSIHLVYKAPMLGLYQLHYCRFRPDYLIWGNPERITTVGTDNTFPHILIDSNDTLHLAWANPSKTDSQLKYQQRTRLSFPRSLWRNETIISDGCASSTQPLLYLLGDSLWIVWNRNGVLYGSFSRDNGYNWSSPIQVDIPFDAEIKLYRISPSIINKNNIRVNLVFGHEKDNKIFFPIIDEVLSKQSKERIAAQKEVSNIEGKKPENYALKVKNRTETPTEEIDKIENKKKEIEAKVSKPANEIVKTYSGLETIKKDLAAFKEKLDYLKEENNGIAADIKKWAAKYEEHSKTIEEMTQKFEELAANAKALSGKGLIQRILDYFS